MAKSILQLLVIVGIAGAAHLSPQLCFGGMNFNPISTNSGWSNANIIGDQVTVEVIDAGFDTLGKQVVDFKFTNNVGLTSSVTDIYFQDGPLLGARLVLAQSPGVSFSDIGVSPKNLPGWNTLTPKFRTTAGFSADADSSPTGLNSAGDWVTFRFTLLNGNTYNQILEALDNGYESPTAVWNNDGTDKSGGLPGLRIGIHVSSIGPRGDSDSFINGARVGVVPEPASLATWGIGACIALALRWRLRRQVVT